VKDHTRKRHTCSDNEGLRKKIVKKLPDLNFKVGMKDTKLGGFN
jgi:hypothetical protein